MATTEERMKILKMIDEGKISAEEGARLLSTLSESRRPPMSSGASRGGYGGARWLRVRVTDVATGRAKATVQLPLNLIDAGMKIGAHFAAEINGVDLEQPDNLAGFQVQINIVEDRAGGQAGHGAHFAQQRVEEARPHAGADVAHRHAESAGRAFQSWHRC
jgi:hypothetical protein